MIIFGNIIAPTLAGLIFLIFFIYFYFIRNRLHFQHSFLPIFLLFFSIFLFTRPVQLLAQYPYPLIINDIRLFLFCAVIAPSYYLFSESLRSIPSKKIILYSYSLGLFLGLLYVIFHSLGTVGSKRIFQVGYFHFYSNDVPSFLPPFYGREISQVVQIAVPIMFFIGAVIKSYFRPGKLQPSISPKSIIFINISISIFALAMVIGGFLKEWTIFYITSIPSMFLFGYGILLNIREMYEKSEIISQLVREEFSQHPSFILAPQKNIGELFAASGLTFRPDTIVLCRINEPSLISRPVAISDDLYYSIRKFLNEKFSVNGYLSIMLGYSMIGICCSFRDEEDAELKAIEFAKQLQHVIQTRHNILASISVGSTYADLSKLWSSYQEAFLAMEYASRTGKSKVVSYKEIREQKIDYEYPLLLKEDFLNALRTGNRNESMKTLTLLLEVLRFISNDDISIFRTRIIEIAIFSSETLISLGMNHHAVFRCEHEFIEEVSSLQDVKSVSNAIEKLINNYILKLRDLPQKRRNELVSKAKAYIHSNYMKPITIDIIADSLHINPAHLMRIFKDCEHTTINSFINQTRINRAKDLFAGSWKSITEVAFEVGFEDSNYFSSVFKKYIKVNPSEFRQQISSERDK